MYIIKCFNEANRNEVAAKLIAANCNPVVEEKKELHSFGTFPHICVQNEDEKDMTFYTIGHDYKSWQNGEIISEVNAGIFIKNIVNVVNPAI